MSFVHFIFSLQLPVRLDHIIILCKDIRRVVVEGS
jgi:hypothetical protein